MADVTRILNALDGGDPHAAAKLLPLVYDELRRLAAQRMAQELPGQPLQPTALVHEAYLRLVGSGEGPRWESRGHFFAAAALAAPSDTMTRRYFTLQERSLPDAYGRAGPGLQCVGLGSE